MITDMMSIVVVPVEMERVVRVVAVVQAECEARVVVGVITVVVVVNVRVAMRVLVRGEVLIARFPFLGEGVFHRHWRVVRRVGWSIPGTVGLVGDGAVENPAAEARAPVEGEAVKRTGRPEMERRLELRVLACGHVNTVDDDTVMA